MERNITLKNDCTYDSVFCEGWGQEMNGLKAMSDGLKAMVKSAVREVLEEVLEKKLSAMDTEGRILSREELCDRWNIASNTLWSWEKQGVIQPLSMGGRKKVYSMKDVLDAETNGYRKRMC